MSKSKELFWIAEKVKNLEEQRDELLEALSGMLILYQKGIDSSVGFKVVEKTLEKFGACPFTQ